jgi:phosphoribosyl 1,2-cyclic phosphate phosphodiesterase
MDFGTQVYGGKSRGSACRPTDSLLSFHAPDLGIVPRQFHTTDVKGQMILLGTGTSVGVPVIGCDCAVCQSDHPHNCRTRCSALLGLPDGNLLIDTSPDLRGQLLRERIALVHAVLFTHEHADHIFGLDDLRLMQFYLGGPVPLYCESNVEARIRKSFDYAFTEEADLHPGAVPQLSFHRIGLEAFEVLGARVTPVRLKHGKRFDVLGFRCGNVAYCTDVNAIEPASLERLNGLDVLVLDALRPHGHATHFSLEEAIKVARQLQPRQTYFTHMCHELEHEATNAALPPGMALAYDGLRIPLT